MTNEEHPADAFFAALFTKEGSEAFAAAMAAQEAKLKAIAALPIVLAPPVKKETKE